MPTILMQSKNVVGSTALGTIVVPTAEELAVFALPELVEWWRADVQFKATQWIGRKAGKILSALSSGWPTLQNSGIGGKPSLVFGPTTGLLDPNAQALIPLTGDFSVVNVVKPVAATNWGIFGTNNASGSATYVQRDTAEKFQARINGTQLALGSTVFGAGQPCYVVNSFEDAANTWITRVNGTQLFSVVTAQVNQNSQLLVGAGASGPFAAGAVGELYSDIMIFNKPLAKSTFADSLAKVETYIATRYGAVFS